MSDDPVRVDEARVLRALSQGELEVQGALPYSSNYTLLCSVTQDDLGLAAVYKPRRGERPLWDFPRGTLYRREVAAYLVSAALGWDLVPPTVPREGPYGIGALQLFVENDSDAHLFTMEREGNYEPIIRQLCVFDVLINNADRKSGHCLKGLDGKLWAIDHGICFHSEYKLRTVVWDFVGQSLPDQVVADLQAFEQRLNNPDALVTALSSLLQPDELQALRRRLRVLLRERRFPEPGPGPNVPWPPV